jgi:hypothetical protein
MPQILDTRTSLDQTVRIFDSFYAFDLQVNAGDFDIIYGYFRTVCATQNIAGNFTAVFFRIAQETGIPVLELLSTIQGTNALQMNKVISYYLNSFKSKTSLYGIATTPPPNQFVARNIIQ